MVSIPWWLFPTVTLAPQMLCAPLLDFDQITDLTLNSFQRSWWINFVLQVKWADKIKLLFRFHFSWVTKSPPSLRSPNGNVLFTFTKNSGSGLAMGLAGLAKKAEDFRQPRQAFLLSMISNFEQIKERKMQIKLFLKHASSVSLSISSPRETSFQDNFVAASFLRLSSRLSADHQTKNVPSHTEKVTISSGSRPSNGSPKKRPDLLFWLKYDYRNGLVRS